MALQSNVRTLISSSAAQIPGTASEFLARMDSWKGDAAPRGFEKWIGEFCASLDGGSISNMRMEQVPMGNPAASYWEVSGSYGGRSLSARLIVPVGDGPHPLIMMFHDAGRSVRGWHHMTRFAGIGMSVLALDQDDAPFETVLLDAITLAVAAGELPLPAPSYVATWGEGFGGALALGVAALSPSTIARCVAANPTAPALGEGSLVHIVRGISCPVLVGTGLMGTTALVEDQFALVNNLVCPCRHIVYPKHGFERINAFEDRVLAFLLSTE